METPRPCRQVVRILSPRLSYGEGELISVSTSHMSTQAQKASGQVQVAQGRSSPSSTLSNTIKSALKNIYIYLSLQIIDLIGGLYLENMKTFSSNSRTDNLTNDGQRTRTDTSPKKTAK